MLMSDSIAVKRELFKLGDIFTLKRGKGIPKNERQEGNIPYVSAKNNNNGVECYVDADSHLFTNALGWVNDGDGGVGYCFYHPYTFRPSNHITVLKPKMFELNQYTGLYFSTIISLTRQKYSRGWSINYERAHKEKIQLPVNKNGDIDFDYIESFMKQLMTKNTAHNKYHKVLEIKETMIATSETKKEIDVTKWQWIRIPELFEVKKGKRYVNHQLPKGKTPYVRASAFNNGVTGFYTFPSNAKVFNRALTIAYNGSVGTCFYHPYDFVASDDIIVLIPKTKYSFKDEHFLFFKVIFELEKPKYSWGRKMHLERFLKNGVKVPINAEGNVDLEAIEDIIKQTSVYKLLK